MNQSETVVYLSNAVTDKLKSQRKIRGDSPAATKKVLDSCRALSSNGVEVTALSMGRGRVHGRVFYHANTCEVQASDIRVVYAAYLNLRVLTYFVSAFSLAACLFKVKTGDSRTLFVYNRVWLYLPTLVLANALGYRCILDLEDDNTATGSRVSGLRVSLLKRIFAYLCRSGTVVINSKLKRELPNNHRALLYYGSAGDQALRDDKFLASRHTVLLSGSLMEETGVGLFIETLTLIENEHPDLAEKLCFAVTGEGSMAPELKALQLKCSVVKFTYKGMVSFQEYQDTVRGADIGLCLKQANNIMGQSTFPSKVVEYVSHSLLLVSTRVSDVENLFSDKNAFFLDDETPEDLISILQKIVSDIDASRESIRRAHTELFALLAEKTAGKILADFLLCRS